jgi:predicted DNA-binding protein (MmcQ/YjbR family)
VSPRPAAPEDARLERVTALCLSLPQTERALRGDHADFRVRQKVFAYFLNSHHNDGIVSVCVRGESGEGADRAARAPALYYLPAYIGARGWFGLRLDTHTTDWREVSQLIELSYCRIAPKKLARVVEERRTQAPP